MTRKSLILAALLVAGCAPDPHDAFRTLHPRVIDGDTFVENSVHYRLARIDAPELPGHCRKGRHCVAGDPWAAKRALQWQLENAWCDPQGLDYYGRTLVECYAAPWRDEKYNINDRLMAQGFAQRYERP